MKKYSVHIGCQYLDQKHHSLQVSYWHESLQMIFQWILICNEPVPIFCSFITVLYSKLRCIFFEENINVFVKSYICCIYSNISTEPSVDTCSKQIFMPRCKHIGPGESVHQLTLVCWHKKNTHIIQNLFRGAQIFIFIFLHQHGRGVSTLMETSIIFLETFPISIKHQVLHIQQCVQYVFLVLLISKCLILAF